MKGAIAIIILLLLVGCKTEYIPVESTRIEYMDRLQRDSVYIHDSIHIQDKGDTVRVEQWHTRYITRLQVDSFCKIDSIATPYPVEVIKEIEKPLSAWQQFRINMGNIAIVILLLGIAYICIRVFR